MLHAEETLVPGPPHSPDSPKPCGNSKNSLSVSIDPLLPSKLITSKALLNSISVCQLAFL